MARSKKYYQLVRVASNCKEHGKVTYSAKIVGAILVQGKLTADVIITRFDIPTFISNMKQARFRNCTPFWKLDTSLHPERAELKYDSR